MNLYELTEEYKKEKCSKCTSKDKCEGIAVAINGKLRCINNQNSIEEQKEM